LSHVRSPNKFEKTATTLSVAKAQSQGGRKKSLGVGAGEREDQAVLQRKIKSSSERTTATMWATKGSGQGRIPKRTRDAEPKREAKGPVDLNRIINSDARTHGENKTPTKKSANTARGEEGVGR